jgi:phosphoglycolate phosphatase
MVLPDEKYWSCDSREIDRRGTNLNVAVLITDLDNTLFDWLEIWHRSFKAMLDQVVAESGVPETVLIREIRDVHQQHGTSEYFHLLEELPSLRRMHPDANPGEVYHGAIQAYRSARSQAMRLYPGVKETLTYIKERGCLVVGYTESLAYYTNYRVRKLGLDGLIDILYSPEDHQLPQGMTKELLRYYPKEHYEFKQTTHRHLPLGTCKPNPAVLMDIIASLGVDKEAVVYVGDSLLKDIVMAQDAGVMDVHAAYGEMQHRTAYDLLRSVTHWPDADVEQEALLLARDGIKPRCVLRESFSELLDCVDFGSFQ